MKGAKIKSVVVLLTMEKKKNIGKKPPFLLYDEEKPPFDFPTLHNI